MYFMNATEEFKKTFFFSLCINMIMSFKLIFRSNNLSDLVPVTILEHQGLHMNHLSWRKNS